MRKGFHGTGVRELSEAVGVGSGTLYHHIGSKEQLLFEITMSLLESAIAQANDITATNVGPESTVRSLARALLEHHATHGDAWSVALHESGSLSDEHRRLVIAGRDEYEALWRTELAKGARARVWRPLQPVEVRGVLGCSTRFPAGCSQTGRSRPLRSQIATLISFSEELRLLEAVSGPSGKVRKTQSS